METGNTMKNFSELSMDELKAISKKANDSSIKLIDEANKNLAAMINSKTGEQIVKDVYFYRGGLDITMLHAWQSFKPRLSFHTIYDKDTHKMVLDGITADFPKLMESFNMTDIDEDVFKYNQRCLELYILFFNDKNFIKEITEKIHKYYRQLTDIEYEGFLADNEINRRQNEDLKKLRNIERQLEFDDAVKEIRDWKAAGKGEGFICLFTNTNIQDGKPESYNFVYRKKTYLPSKTPQGKRILDYKPRGYDRDSTIKFVSIYDLKDSKGNNIYSIL